MVFRERHEESSLRMAIPRNHLAEHDRLKSNSGPNMKISKCMMNSNEHCSLTVGRVSPSLSGSAA